MKQPDIARIADEVKALLIDIDSEIDIRHQPAQRLVVLLGGGDGALDGALEFLVVELAGNAERYRQIEMTNPQAIDPLDRRHGICILDAFRRLALAEQGSTAVGG